MTRASTPWDFHVYHILLWSYADFPQIKSYIVTMYTRDQYIKEVKLANILYEPKLLWTVDMVRRTCVRLLAYGCWLPSLVTNHGLYWLTRRLLVT